MRKLLSLIATGILGAVAGWYLWVLTGHEGTHAVDSEQELAYELDISNAIPADLKLEGNQRLGLLVGVPVDGQPPQYLSVLSRRYQDDGLRVVLVASPSYRVDFVHQARASGIDVHIDRTGAVQQFLRSSLDHRHGTTFMWDRESRVKFHAHTVVKNDLLRQLVEKYLVGEITYSFDSVLSAGLTGTKLSGLVCGRRGEPLLNNSVVVVFPPGCSSCEFPQFKKPLRRLIRSSVENDQRLFLVFPGGLDTLLSEVLPAQFGLSPENICVLRSDRSIDSYATRSGDPILYAISIGRDGIVQQVTPLKEVVRNEDSQ